MTADFSGYATRSNVRCSDGRTILANAFAHQDGETVPLVWAHGHDEVTNVLGHAILKSVDDGVRIQAFFNETNEGKHAKEVVRHGDVKWLSIFANQLKEKTKQVAHGMIREVSLVLAGANPGANIDQVAIVHSDGDVQVLEDEAHITTGLEIELEALAHADAPAPAAEKPATKAPEKAPEKASDDETLQDILDTLNEKQQNAVNFLLSQALTVESEVKHSDTDTEGDAEADAAADSEDKEEAPADSETEEGADKDADSEDKEEAPADSETEEGADKDADAAAEADSNTETGAGDDAVQHDNNNQEDTSMTHNLFDQAHKDGTAGHSQVTLSHDDVQSIIQGTIKHGSMKEAVQHFVADTGVTVGGELKHGIENIEYLFPDAKLLESSPQFIARRMEWVDKVLGGVRKSPFSRVKTVTADITPDEARARGYIKGNMKNEEYFALAKRETTPQTIYKKQKLDRDDVIDIVDLDVVAWMKAEMKVMLDEELAGAILVGDGRSAGDEDKIREDKIRPIATDAELYVTTVNVNLDDANSSIEEFVDAAILNRKYYKGTGSPTFYTTEDIISAFLSVKDNFGRRIYTTVEDIKTVLRVSDIVPVEIMERQPEVVGIMVNLTDYTLGADRGGQATMFDDFDIDYNKLRYLIETRVSGALTLPKSALVFRKVAGTSVLVVPTAPTFNDDTGVLTVPTVTGVVYKDGDGTTLTTGSPVTVPAGESITVNATPASGKYFASSANDSWTYTRPSA